MYSISSNPALILPDFHKTFFLQTDSITFGIAAVLLQEQGEMLRPIMNASRHLLDQEKRYTIIELECLALGQITNLWAFGGW